ncbi:uncharacterized protein LOC110056015 [Orbicella faveolata]|uniref:uncharacterized protein LOC110056015 n=1 Tax=Orbicella faveolata TaxID=48498 RepID=UPI0009E5B44E|nr:uncharacterized protein LOC110056015 [Orbicella faveolata]
MVLYFTGGQAGSCQSRGEISLLILTNQGSIDRRILCRSSNFILKNVECFQIHSALCTDVSELKPNMELRSFIRFCQLMKMFVTFSGVLIFNHTSSHLLLRFCGYSIVSMVVVYVLCFTSLAIFWCGFQRSLRASGTRERQQILQDLRSIETEKIPLIIDRFLELDRAGTQRVNHANKVADCAADKQCVVCLDAEACIQTFPCEHVVVCGWCAWQSLKIAFMQQSPHRCVVCRTEIQDFSGCLIKDLVNLNWKDVKKIIEEIKTG